MASVRGDRAALGSRINGRAVGFALATRRRSPPAEIAAEHGATVVFEPRRGYGQAYLTGIAHARGDYETFAFSEGWS